MILRSALPYPQLQGIIEQVILALEAQGILPHPGIYSHVFHYSKGPFEQILDGSDYVCDGSGEPVDPRQLSFFAYLLERGFTAEEILAALRDPIAWFRTPYGAQEHHLFVYTDGDTFPEAARKFRSRIPDRP